MRGCGLAILAVVSASCGGDDGDRTMTSAQRDDITLSTTDGKTLTGYLSTSETSSPGAPGVVLVHQFQRDDEQWGDLPDLLAGDGYITLAFNLRGHGDSDPNDGPLGDLLSDPVAAPADLTAALDYVAGDGGADPARIAVIGTSIGASLTVAAAIGDLATTYDNQASARTLIFDWLEDTL